MSTFRRATSGGLLSTLSRAVIRARHQEPTACGNLSDLTRELGQPVLHNDELRRVFAGRVLEHQETAIGSDVIESSETAFSGCESSFEELDG